MKLRCASGILALVVHDTPPCQANLGRVVHVRGPVAMNRQLRRLCWLVKPVTSAPYAVEFGKKLVIGPVYWKMRIEHPDAWLLPLEGMDLGQQEDETSLDAGSIGQVDWDKALDDMLRRHPATHDTVRR